MLDKTNMKQWKLTGFIATLIIVITIPIYIASFYLKDISEIKDDEAEYIGREKCKSCHQKEYDAWLNSHHDKAMDVANDSTVLGDFNNTVFEFNGVTSKFYKKDGKFFVYTNGIAGIMSELEITHTFGYTPLQQYLIPFEKGRYQCLPIAWDTEKGKWFSLIEATYPNDYPDPNDWLYWTNNAQNWNGMCAECHSTNLQKNYDLETQTYNTTYSEIDVSCEACHGPGSKHEEWANLPEMARSTDANTELLVKTSSITNQEYVDLCVYCHSRRSSLSPLEFTNGHAMDMVIPTVLNENYFPDGQILEEDYVYSSFTHSKMFNNDIKCNDCHDVHSGKRLFEGNELCAQCHQPDVYDNYEHHFHKKEGEKGNPIVLKDKTYKVGEGALCVNCHMPGRYYMGNDFRNDHSLRIPRPDLTISIGVSNACNQCHSDKMAQWSEDYITKWYGIKRKPHFGTVIAAGRKVEPWALDGLIKIVKDGLHLPLVRATAVSLLENYRDPKSLETIEWAIKSDDPMIRYYAAHVLRSGDPEILLKNFVPLITDPIKAIRIEAGNKLSALPLENLPNNKRSLIQDVIQEYIEAMNYSADFAASRHNLGIINSNLQNYEMVIKHYNEAIRIDSLFYPAKANLAATLNHLGRNDEAEKFLRDMLRKHPEFNDTYYSLGLLLAEKQNYDEAVEYMQKAAELMPARGRIFYNLGLILQFQNKNTLAEEALINAANIEPNNLDFLYALADHYIKRNELTKAKTIAEEIKIKFPSNQMGDQLIEYIEKL